MRLDAPAYPTTPTPLDVPASDPAGGRSGAARIGAVSSRLDDEWRRLRRQPAALTTVNGWAIVPTTLDDLQDLLVAVGYRAPGDRGADRAGQNARLHRLLVRARTDDLAARIVLQRLVPGLVVDLARRRDRHGYQGSRFEELVGSAWISIRSAHVADNCPCVAGRLMDDAWYRAFRAPRRKRAAQEVVVDPGTFQQLPDVVEATPFEELAGIVAEARRRGLDADDLKLLRALVAAESSQRLAAELRVTPRTVRNHRDRVVHSLRRLAAA